MIWFFYYFKLRIYPSFFWFWRFVIQKLFILILSSINTMFQEHVKSSCFLIIINNYYHIIFWSLIMLAAIFYFLKKLKIHIRIKGNKKSWNKRCSFKKYKFTSICKYESMLFMFTNTWFSLNNQLLNFKKLTFEMSIFYLERLILKAISCLNDESNVILLVAVINYVLCAIFIYFKK